MFQLITLNAVFAAASQYPVVVDEQDMFATQQAYTSQVAVTIRVWFTCDLFLAQNCVTFDRVTTCLENL